MVKLLKLFFKRDTNQISLIFDVRTWTYVHFQKVNSGGIAITIKLTMITIFSQSIHDDNPILMIIAQAYCVFVWQPCLCTFL